MNGRNALMLATTTPGVLPGTKGTQGVPPGQDFIGAGTREIQNSMSLDGISIMNNLITTSPTQPMVETVQEVEVQTGTYSAQYGAYMGVHLNMITKGGTNSIHGNLVEFIRNDAFDARGYFLPATSRKTALRQNQYGFELDGPVFIPKLYNGKDKTFFMGSWERLRNKRQSLSANNTVMTEQMFAGNFSQTPTIVKDPLNNNTPFAGNIVPTNRLSPIALSLQQYYVKPSNPNAITQNFTTIFPAKLTSDATVDRIDQNIGSKTRLFFRYQRQVQAIANGNAIPYNAAQVPSTTDNFTVGYTQTVTPTLVNDFRIGRQGINTDSVNYFYVNGIADAGTKLGIAGFDADTKGKNPGHAGIQRQRILRLGKLRHQLVPDRFHLAGIRTDQLDPAESRHHGRHRVPQTLYLAQRRQQPARRLQLQRPVHRICARRFHARLCAEPGHTHHSVPGRRGHLARWILRPRQLAGLQTPDHQLRHPL